MNIWNKILLSFILVASLAFLYLAVKDLRLHRQWGDVVKVLQGTAEEPDSIESQLKLQDEKINGKQSEGVVVVPGIRQLSVELNKLMLERGRAWFGCQPMMVDEEGIRVKTSLPDPHGITAKSVVYVFEQKPAGQGCGSYLGQVAVAAVAPQMVQLQPSRQLSPQELQRVGTSAQNSQQTPDLRWVLFETLPIDKPAAFANLTPEQMQDLPPSVVEMYNDKEYQLRDYEIYFREAHRIRSQTADMLAAATRDKQYVDEANADAKLQEDFRSEEIVDLNAEKKAVNRELQAVSEHRANLQGKVNAVRTAIIETIQENSELAGEIAKRQLEALGRVDEQPSRQVAQVAGG